MQQSVTTCAHCGASVRGRFCTACGARVADPASTYNPPFQHDPDATSMMFPRERDPDATSTISASSLRDLLSMETSRPPVTRESNEAPVTVSSLHGETRAADPLPDAPATDSMDSSPDEKVHVTALPQKQRGPLTRFVLALISGLTGRSR